MSLPRYPVAVDAVVFGASGVSVDGGRAPGLEVLLIQRGIEPFIGQWALPGGLVLPEEDIETAVRRELLEEAGIAPAWLEQLYTFGKPDRDPRGRTITVAWLGLVQPAQYLPSASTDAHDARWWSLSELPELAFDHADILEVARNRLRGKVRYQPVGFDLLPEAFTLTELQTLYEVILERPLDKRNFRRKIGRTGLLIDTGENRTGAAHRAPRLYRFDRDRYLQLEKEGYLFEV